MMTTLKQELVQLTKRLPAIEALITLIRQQQSEAWLVGGVLRDLVLQRKISDIDLATVADPTSLAKQWARQVGGRWFWLDPNRLQSRVLLTNRLTVDFAPLRAESINEDQALRDFTINSLAFPLHQDFDSAALLDPLNAIAHLQQKRLQTCSAQSFVDDPLRMLKGIRHLVTLDLQLTTETLGQLRNHAALLEKVAGERSREELGRIFSADNCFVGIKLLMETGLLAALFGPAGPDWKESTALKVMLALEQQMSLAGLKVTTQIDSHETHEYYSHHTLFLLAALLKCYATQNLPDILHRRLRLSRQQQRLLIALQTEPAAVWFAWAVGQASSRRQALIVEQLGYAADEQLLYLAICPNDLSYKRALQLRRSFIKHQQLGRIPDLISGEQIRELLSNPSGQDIGLWQQRIKAAEITGEIATADAARSLIKDQISI
jgi:poly(A) polymerase